MPIPLVCTFSDNRFTQCLRPIGHEYDLLLGGPKDMGEHPLSSDPTAQALYAVIRLGVKEQRLFTHSRFPSLVERAASGLIRFAVSLTTSTENGFSAKPSACCLVAAAST